MHVIDLNVNKKQVLKILCAEHVPFNSEEPEITYTPLEPV